MGFNDYEEKLNELLKFDAVRKLHRRHLAAAQKLNGSMFCGSCDPCRCGGNIVCSTITRDIVLCINDGSCEDIERWLAFSIFGYYNPSTTVLPAFTLTASTISSDLVVLGLGTLTMAQLMTLLGMDERDPKINDSIAFGGFGTTYIPFNGYFSIVGLPSLANPTFLLKMWNPFKFDFCNAGLLPGDYIQIELGPSAGVYEITDVVNDDTNWVLVPTSIGSFALVTPMPTCKPPIVYHVVCGPNNHELNSDDEAARRRERANRHRRHDSWSSSSSSSSSSEESSSSSDSDC